MERLKPWQPLTERCKCGNIATQRVIHIEATSLSGEPDHFNRRGAVHRLGGKASKVVYTCDEHFSAEWGAVKSGNGGPLRDTWAYWIKSLWWRPYRRASRAFWKAAHQAKTSR